MKNVLLPVAALSLSICVSTAYAGGDRDRGHDRDRDRDHNYNRYPSTYIYRSDTPTHVHSRTCGHTTQSVPEINGASTGIALALLGGLVAIRRERKQRA